MANAGIDENSRQTLTAISSVDLKSIVELWADPITHRLLVDAIGSLNFVDNEIVSGSGTSFTLAHTPVAGSVHLFGYGQRLTPGAGNDFTISGAVITIIQSGASYTAGSIIADYRY